MLTSYYFCMTYSFSVFTLPNCVLFAFFHFRQLALELCKRLF